MFVLLKSKNGAEIAVNPLMVILVEPELGAKEGSEKCSWIFYCSREDGDRVVQGTVREVARKLGLKDEQHGRMSVDAILHPQGRCECSGEGVCDWCRRVTEAEG